MTSIHHNTADEVEGYLRSALTLVEILEPPEDLRQSCFEKAIDLISGKTLVGQPDLLAGGGLLRP